MQHEDVMALLDEALCSAASGTLALSLQRYFPTPVSALGVSNAAVAAIAAGAVARAPALGLDDWAQVADRFARRGGYHEHMMLASALLAKVARCPDPEARLLTLMIDWLECCVGNWAQCDDLCIKPLYLYLKHRPALLAGVSDWGQSASPWSRRASNVALVKFVGRNDCVDFASVLANCAHLLPDGDPYVQKGIGWLLKVASQYEYDAVLAFLHAHRGAMARPTLRYATEKLPAQIRRALLA